MKRSFVWALAFVCLAAFSGCDVFPDGGDEQAAISYTHETGPMMS